MPALTSTPILVTSSSTYLLSQIIVLHTSQSKFSSPRDALLATSKLIGGCHALLAGGLALRDVLDRKWIDHDLITTKSTFGDGIVALEAGYLIGGQFVVASHVSDGCRIHPKCRRPMTLVRADVQHTQIRYSSSGNERLFEIPASSDVSSRITSSSQDSCSPTSAPQLVVEPPVYSSSHLSWRVSTSPRLSNRVLEYC